MVEWKKLGEIANLVRGKVISKDYIRDFEGEYPVYSSQTANDGVLGSINSYMFNGDYLTWTTDGAYAGTIFRRKGKFSITNVCGLIDITDSYVHQDFLYFWLSKTAKNYVLEGMGNPKLMSNVASTILVPIPSLSEQNRIVGILDTFTASIDNLVNTITSTTPDEVVSTLAGALGTQGQQGQEALQDQAGELIEGAQEQAGEVIEGAQEKAGELIDGAQQKAGELIDGAQKELGL